MKILKIVSKKHGTFKIKLDDDDYRRVTEGWNTPKWCVRICKNRHNLFYFQKRLSGKTKEERKLIEMHRYLMGFPNGIVDHINGDTTDNRRKNLRVISNADNIRKGKVRTNNKSGYTGVRWEKKRKKWLATIRVNYKTIHLGRFILKKDAIKARKLAEKKYNYEITSTRI
jgi:hypothetical protein